MLDQRVFAIGQLQATDNGHTVSIPIQCHHAVCYWLYSEANGHAPTGNVFLRGTLSQPTAFLTGLARMGKPLNKEDLKSGYIDKGHVLIFIDEKFEAKHSCITKTGSVIGGYNQLNWFSTPGIQSNYTEHHYQDIRWVKPGVVRLNTEKPRFCGLITEPSEGFLIAVPARQALLFFRGNFKPD